MSHPPIPDEGLDDADFAGREPVLSAATALALELPSLLEVVAHFATGAARPLDVPDAVVHHFKWHAAVVPALESRAELLRRQKVSFAVESERVLTYLAEHGRLVPEHFDARPGWDSP